MELADELQTLGLRGLELQVLHDVFRLGDREVADRARVLAASIEGPRATAIEQLMAAEVEDDIGGLVAASQAFEDFGAWLYAAEAAAVAAGRFADAGRAASAREATKRVTRLRRSTCRVTVPLLADSAPVELTAREREGRMARGKRPHQPADRRADQRGASDGGGTPAPAVRQARRCRTEAS